MTIVFKIEDDVILATETCEITLKGDLFDKPKKDNKHLISMLKSIAKLRGHETRYISVEVKEIT
jgi:hypothetical protein